MKRVALAVSGTFLLGATACLEDPVLPPLDYTLTALQARHALPDDIDPVALRGLSVRADGGFDVLVDARGIVHLNADGSHADEYRVGERGLENRAYNDVASLADTVDGNARFALISNNEGYVYSPAEESLAVKFCVEPGFEGGGGVPTLISQRNEAVAVAGNRILAAPRFYEETNEGMTLTSSEVRTYDAASGAELSRRDVTATGLEIEGLAVAGDAILAVAGTHLFSLSLDGEPLADGEPEGLVHGVGLTVDLGGGKLHVLDVSTGEILTYGLPQ